MSVDPEDQFIEKMKATLTKSGFPAKKVSLPLEKVKAAAESRKLDFEFILSRLGMMDFPSTIEGDKIIFAVQQEATANPFGNMGGLGDMDGLGDMLGGLDLGSLKSMSQEELMGQVSKMMQEMSPDQQAGMMDMYKNMSEEEKANILNKAGDMGIDPQAPV
jgi:hypothetical protein